MTDRCPLCGEPLFQGKCTKCGYIPPVKEELDAEAGVYDFDPSSYPSDEDEIKNALPPLERDIKYDEPSALYADSIMAEPLGGEYTRAKKISLKKPAKPAPVTFADPASKPQVPVNLKKYENPDEAALIQYIAKQKDFDADTLDKLMLLQNLRDNADMGQKVTKREFLEDRPAFEAILEPDPYSSDLWVCLMLSILVPFLGIVAGTQLLRRAEKPLHYVVGALCLLFGLMIFIAPGIYGTIYSGEID